MRKTGDRGERSDIYRESKTKKVRPSKDILVGKFDLHLLKFRWKVLLIPASVCGREGSLDTVDRDAAVIAFFAPIIEECRRTGHSTAEMR